MSESDEKQVKEEVEEVVEVEEKPQRKRRTSTKREPREPREPKEPRERKVLEEKCSGKVKWFNVRAGYGFIERGEEKKDVFVHRTSIPYRYSNRKHSLRSLGDGEAVEFTVVEGRKGEEAWMVMGPEGERLEGSEFAPLKYQRKSKTSESGKEEGRPQRRRTPRKSEGDKDSVSESAGSGKRDEAKRRPRYHRGRRSEPKTGEGDAKTDDEKAEKPRRQRKPRTPKSANKDKEGEDAVSDGGQQVSESSEPEMKSQETGLVKKMMGLLVSGALKNGE